jgi:hypothetical protein
LFPLNRGELILAVESNRDGYPIAWEGDQRIPIYARYFLTDEFQTPLLDPSCCYFLTANEVRFIADVYFDLRESGHPCPDRSFHDLYVIYWKLARRMPLITTLVILACKNKRYGELIELLHKIVDGGELPE